jgi:hypothetical protein
VPQEVTVRISVQPEGAQAADQGQAATTEGAEPARPMELEQLQLSGTGEAPPPLGMEQLASLSASQAQVAEDDAPPPPLEVEQLQAGGGGGAPVPQSLESLEAQAEGGEGGVPRPMAVEELEQLASEESGGGSGSRRSARRRG